MKTPNKESIIKWLLFGLVVAIGYWLWQNFDLAQVQGWIESFGIWAPVVFTTFYTLALLTFFSSTVLTILSGVLFGKIWGTVYVVIGATISAQLAFMISRRLSGDQADKLKKVKGIGVLIKELESRLEEKGLQNFILLRCLFLPYIGLSYAAGLIKTAKNSDFILGTFLTNLIFSPAFVFFGDSILDGPKALILPAVMILLVLVVPKVIKRFQKNA